MVEDLIIRQETPNDFAAIHEVNQAAFGQAAEANLVDALRENTAIFVPELSIVASLNDQIVGHILFTKVIINQSDNIGYESLALAPMAVKPGLQRQGIGGQLIRNGIEVAKSLGFSSVIVLGHENYYPRFGFQPAEKWKIKAPFEVPSNFFMAIELKEDSLKNISGTVIYPAEFERV